MIRIAHLSDLHLCERVRFAGTLRVLEAFVQGVEDRGVDLVLIAGDLVDPRRAPARATPDERNAFARAVVRLARVAPVVVVRGNHDAIGDWSFLGLLESTHPIHVVEDGFWTGTVWRDGAGRGRSAGVGIRVHAIPWISPRWFADQVRALELDQEEGQAWIEDAVRPYFDAIRADVAERGDLPHVGVAHLSVRGGRLANGQALVGGEVQIGADVLAGLGLDYVALGHLHERQEVAPGIWYAGSPNRLDFGEAGKPCSWNLVDLDDDGPRVTFVELPADELLTLEAVAVDREIGGPVLDLRDGDPSRAAEGVEVRLRVIVPEGLAAEDQIAQMIAELEGQGAAVLLERIPAAALRARDGAEEIAAAPTIRDKVAAFLGQRSIPADQVARILARFDELEERAA